MKLIPQILERREWWVLSAIFTALLAMLVGTAPGEQPPAGGGVALSEYAAHPETLSRLVTAIRTQG